MLPKRGDGDAERLPQVARDDLLHAAADEQRHEERGAHHRHDQQGFERGFGHELDQHHLPVRSGDQRAALQGVLDRFGERHRASAASEADGTVEHYSIPPERLTAALQHARSCRRSGILDLWTLVPLAGGPCRRCRRLRWSAVGSRGQPSGA